MDTLICIQLQGLINQDHWLFQPAGICLLIINCYYNLKNLLIELLLLLGQIKMLESFCNKNILVQNTHQNHHQGMFLF